MKKRMLAALIGAAAAIALTGCGKESGQTDGIVWSTTAQAGAEETAEETKAEETEAAAAEEVLPSDSTRCDEDYRQRNQDCLSQGYGLYGLADGGSADGGSADGGTYSDRPSAQTSVQTDFVFRTEFKNALGNGEEYILDTFGKPDEFYKGTEGEVTDQNWYTYEEPWCSFTLRRSLNSVVEVFGNTETLFELSKDYYTVEEVSALLGAGQNIETYEGEDVEGAFAGSGEMDYHCENEYYSFDFILKDGKVAGNSRCLVSFSPYLCMY